MPTVSVGDMIGKTLIAKGNVLAYAGYPKSLTKKTLSQGEIIGKIYSWVKDPDNAANVYWMFPEKYGDKYFYVKHDVNKLKLHSSETVETVEEKLKREEEEKKKLDMGIIPYYLEKYGKPILFLGGAALAVKAYSIYSGSNKK